jgi:molybdopterin synthase sulfur carrier subunit
MNITIRYFANMRDQMGRAEETVTIEGDSVTVEDVWGKVSSAQALPGNVLIAVNMEYTDGSRVLKNGDEVAFFPPVTGG